jgi:cytochrome c-type biogenesis protein CcsB
LETIIQITRWLGLVLAVAASFFYIRLFFRGGGNGARRGRALLWGAAAFMTVAIALRAIQLQTVPLLAPVEALYFYSWLVFLVYLVVMRAPGHDSLGALLVPFGTLCSLFEVTASAAAMSVNPIFRNPIFALHTMSAFLGYSALSVACFAGVLYIVQHDQVSNMKMGRLYNRLPPLEDLDQLGFRTVVLGFLLLTVAIIAGAVWARQEWGVNWVWDPKAVWTTLSWLVYAVYLVVRSRAGWRGERAAWLAASGFAFSILMFLSTNYLLAAGRHVFQ